MEQHKVPYIELLISVRLYAEFTDEYISCLSLKSSKHMLFTRSFLKNKFENAYIGTPEDR